MLSRIKRFLGIESLTNFQRANKHLAAKRYDRAIQLYLRHAEQRPTDAAKAYAGAAECCLRSNVLDRTAQLSPELAIVAQADVAGAERFFRLALQADPHNFRSVSGLAKILPENSQEKRDLLERAVTLQPGTLNLIDLGDYYRTQEKDPDRTYQLYLQAQQHNPKDQTAYLKLNDICRRLGRSEEAQQWSDRWQEAKRQKRSVGGRQR